MSQVSREKQREEQRATHAAAPSAAPVAVHVPAHGGCATVDGAPVRTAPGEGIQQAVLNHLRRLALAAGRPVLATITDERSGYAVPLRVHGDGSSSLTAEPSPMPPAGEAVPPARPPAPEAEAVRGVPYGTAAAPKGEFGPPPAMHPGPAHTAHPAGAASTHAAYRTPSALPSAPSAQPASPSGPAPASVAPVAPSGTPSVPVTRPVPASVAAPSAPAPAALPSAPVTHPVSAAASAPAPVPVAPASRSAAVPGSAAGRGASADAVSGPTPARGFDAVAEAVLGDDPRTLVGEEGHALLAEPTARISEAVKEGRIETAAALAERTVTEASAALGPEHPEVLALRELSAYVAYLAGDPVRAFRLSLGLARVRRRLRDAEGSYGDVQSAATAWRAVRDPEEGLRLGRDLIGLWSDLAAEDGPAAEDAERLASARARMGRLAERAARTATG
ncbi:tetratricopeptide repeat protein [Streptomyces sp. NPDC046831]|uniref:tetratricopeptide repeat protein n=1 Tax=Streptomyces sp. NPDC046831 TaxID=3154805 RepID=UPI0033F4FD57